MCWASSDQKFDTVKNLYFMYFILFFPPCSVFYLAYVDRVIEEFPTLTAKVA
jgi:hypothetical protein